MEKTVITFNDLPEVVAQLRDEVMSLRSLLTEQRSVNNAKTEYLGIPKGTLYMKLSDGSIPATKPGKRYCLYRDELDRWLESSRKNPVPLSDEELSESMSSSHRRKPGQRNW
jgi:excisionase family DNA binding protein